MRRMLLALTVSVAAMSAAAATAFGGNGPPHLGIYVNGALYRTVGTPTDFSGTGAPLASFETLYNFGPAQSASVATAAPGDAGFRGGRWQVHTIAFTSTYAAALAAHDANGSGSLDSVASVPSSRRTDPPRSTDSGPR